jgi:hypothetical protein
MKKLALDVDSLSVESFGTEVANDLVHGTVRGHEGSSAHAKCKPGDTRSLYWGCVTGGMYTCAC